MIKGVIFDADGTLIDSMHIWNEVGARYLTSLGKVPGEGLSDIIFPMTLEESSEYLKAHYGLTKSIPDIRNGILRIIADFYRQEVSIKNGVMDFLEKIHRKHLPMVIATSGDRELLISALRRLRVDHYFEAIFTCSELNTSKREAMIYRTAADAINTEIEHTAVFEDVLVALETANNAGFFTVAIEDTASAKEKEKIRRIADLYMTDFSDFERFWKVASAN